MASSTWGTRSEFESRAISSRSGRNSAAACGGSTSQVCMSTMNQDFFSWKPTSTPPFLSTRFTEKRARWR